MDDLSQIELPNENDLDYELDDFGFSSESFLDRVDSNTDDLGHQQEDVHDNNMDDTHRRTSTEVDGWSISLANVPSTIRIAEYGQIYVYGRVIDPDGIPTGKFKGFFKNTLEETPHWHSLAGLLTNKYTVVSLEKFVNSTVRNKFENIQDLHIHRMEPWRSVWMGILDSLPEGIVNYINPNSTANLIFQNLSENEVRANTINSKLGFIITNTYNGTNKLKISPIVKTTGNVSNSRDVIIFIDYFTFSNFTRSISHGSESITDIENDIPTIRENLNEHVSLLKEIHEVDSIIQDISRCFRKPGREIFENIINTNLTENNIGSNLFHVLIAASIALGKKYSIIEFLAIRSKVEMLFEQIF